MNPTVNIKLVPESNESWIWATCFIQSTDTDHFVVFCMILSLNGVFISSFLTLDFLEMSSVHFLQFFILKILVPFCFLLYHVSSLLNFPWLLSLVPLLFVWLWLVHVFCCCTESLSKADSAANIRSTFIYLWGRCIGVFWGEMKDWGNSSSTLIGAEIKILNVSV